MIICSIAADSGVAPSRIVREWSLEEILDIAALNHLKSLTPEEIEALDREPLEAEPQVADVVSFFDAHHAKSNAK